MTPQYSRIAKITKIVIHHSASGRDSTTFEDIKRWHLQKGWIDIGYHFITMGDGSFKIGRPETAMGSHSVGFNYNTLGICVTGNFMTEKPSTAQIKTLIQILAALCKRHGLKASDIIGHRDVNNTSCPGDNLYNLLVYIRLEVSKYL